MHILRVPAVGHKGHHRPEAVVGKGQARLLPDFTEETFLGAFPLLKFAAYPDPLVVVDVVFLLYPVEHQVLPLGIFNVA